MAGRTPDMYTSSFKPLDLDTIMRVPLSKQKAEDELSLAVDEFSLLEQNALEKDKAYVANQIAGFQEEASGLGDQLIERGVDSNLINKVRSLRNKKNQEFSLQGKTGQAGVQFNKHAANVQAINQRKDLTAQQKEFGIRKSLEDYVGVEQGGAYEDYIGTAYQDVMQKGKDIASKMTPQEKAWAIGATYDDNTGFYYKDNYVIKKLTPEHIEKVVYQGLKGDRAITDYTSELGVLGIEENPDTILREAAQNAANTYQKNDSAHDRTLLPQWAQSSLDMNKGTLNNNAETGQPWETSIGTNIIGMHEKNLEVFSEESLSDNFFDEDGNIVDPLEENAPITSSYRGRGGRARGASRRRSAEETKKERVELKNKIVTIRQTYPSLGEGQLMRDPVTGEMRPITDKDVAQLIGAAVKKADQQMSAYMYPENRKNSFYTQKENVIGNGTRIGSFSTSTVMKPGGAPKANDQIWKDYEGFDSQEEFNTAVSSTGTLEAIAPADPNMPGATVIRFTDGEGAPQLLYVTPGNNAKDTFKPVAIHNQLLSSSENYNHRIDPTSGRHEMVVKDFNINSGEFTTSTVRSDVEIPKAEIDQLNFTPTWNQTHNMALMIADYYDEEGVRHPVVKTNYTNEVQLASNKIANHYDKLANQTQTLTKGQKNSNKD